MLNFRLTFLLDLQAIREEADVSVLTKLINGLLDCPLLLSQLDFCTPPGLDHLICLAGGITQVVITLTATCKNY